MELTGLLSIMCWQDAVAAVVTLAAIYGAVIAIFWSLPMNEIFMRIDIKNGALLQRTSILSAEVSSGYRYVKSRDHFSKGDALPPWERDSKRIELAIALKRTYWARLLLYGLSCAACQSFWMALIFYAIAGASPIDALCSALVAFFVGRYLGLKRVRRPVRNNEEGNGESCEGCGK